MNAHFSNFTAEAMQAFRKSLNAGSHRRAEFVNNSCKHTSTLLAGFRKRHGDAEEQRRQHAARQAQDRRRFMSNLRSGVNQLLNRFEQHRQERAEDLQEMNREFRAASESFRDGTKRPGDTS